MAGPPSQVSEIHSFVRKFLSLCQAGYKAALSMECNAAGKADINFKVELENVSPFPVPKFQAHPHHRARAQAPGPSRLRRRQRRAEARQSTAAEAVENGKSNNSEEATFDVTEEVAV